MNTGLIEEQEGKEADIPDETGHPNFEFSEVGLEKVTMMPKPKGDGFFVKRTYVGGRLEVLGRANITYGQKWSTVVAFNAPDGTRQLVVVANADLAGDGKTAREKLANAGFQMSATRDGRNALSEFILSHPNEKIFTIADQRGWVGNDFVYADEVFSASEADTARRSVLFDSTMTGHSFAKNGTLEAWQHYANLAKGNPLMLMILAAAFAGPLLKLLREEAGGVHLHGVSSRGKTSVAWYAATVWGPGGENGFINSWHGTINGVESLGYVYSDTALFLDELGQGKVEDLEALIYLFGNGQGKLRATKTGALGAVQQCRTFVISTGEESISERIKSGGRRGVVSQLKAGAAMRMISIPAASADSVGLFEDLHGHESEASFVATLRAGSLENYGFAGPAFLRSLVADREKHTEFCKKAIVEFVSEVTDDADDPQIARCARRFALIVAAGSLAEQLGILKFPLGTCRDGVLECFERWKLDQVPQQSREERDVIERTRRFLAAHGDNRFDQIVGSSRRRDVCVDTEDDVKLSNLPKHNRAGYFKENESGIRTYFILPGVFEDEICAGYDNKMAGRVLRDAGFLISGEGNRICKKVRVPDLDQPMRLYAIRSSIISDDT